MHVIARGAFERPDVKARWTWGDACQHGCDLAHGARWSLDKHDASPRSGGSAILSVTGSCQEGGGDATSMRPEFRSRWSIMLMFQKLIEGRCCARRSSARPVSALACWTRDNTPARWRGRTGPSRPPETSAAALGCLASHPQHRADPHPELASDICEIRTRARRARLSENKRGKFPRLLAP
jgi:hypothetical protein